MGDMGWGSLWCGGQGGWSWGIVVILRANDGFFVYLFRFSKSRETSRWGLMAMISYFAFEINTNVYKCVILFVFIMYAVMAPAVMDGTSADCASLFCTGNV